MSTRRPRPSRRAHWVRARRRLAHVIAGRRVRTNDDGFTLLEMIISIAIITIVMAALTTVYVTTLSSMSSLRIDQAASRISTDAIDQARAVGATEAIAGRGSAAVAAQFTAAPATVRPWLDAMDSTSDSQAPATAGANATLPTQPTNQILDNVTFSIDYYVGLCYRLRSTGTSNDACVKAAARSSDPGDVYVTYARVVVAVTWSGPHCAGAACSDVNAILLNGDPDPIFNLNTDPPPPPKLTNCQPQKNAAKDVFDATNPPTLPGAFFLETAATSKDEVGLCTLADGVPPFTFTVADKAGHPLPQGLSLSATGVITGTITGGPKIYSGIKITVTDAFLRQSTGNAFDWEVVGPLVINPVPDQVSVAGTSIAPLNLTATGGYGAPYTWSAAGLPDGLILDPATGALAGTPTTAGVVHVTITARDSDVTRARTASLAVTWTVYDPLTFNNLGNQANSLGDAVNLSVGVSGGSGDHTVTAAGLPAGLAVVGDSTSGYRIAGTIAAGGVYDFTLTATDAVPAVPPAETDIVWAVADGGPIVANPGHQTSRSGESVTLPIAAACGPNTPCTWTVSGPVPNGITFNAGSGTFSGAPSQTGDYVGITVTYTDSATDAGGAPTPQSASATFSWTVSPPASMTIGNQRTALEKAATLITPTISNAAPGAIYTFSAATEVSGNSGTVANGLPQGLTIDTATGAVSGTPTSAGIYDVTVTADSPTDASISAVFTWYVLGFNTIPAQSCTVAGGAGPMCGGSSNAWTQVIANLSPFTAGSTNSATFGGATITGANTSATNSGQFGRTLTLKAPVAGTYSVTVSVTDSGGNAPSATAKTSFIWTVTGWSGTLTSIAYPTRYLQSANNGNNASVSLSSSSTTWSVSGDGTISAGSGPSKRCLTDPGPNSTPTLTTCGAGANQRWSVDSNGRLVSGLSRFLQASRTGNGNNYSVTMASSASGDSAKWTLSP